MDPSRIVSSTLAFAPPMTSTGTLERTISNLSPTASDIIAVVISDLNADGPSPVVKTKICSKAANGLPDDIDGVARISGDFGSAAGPGSTLTVGAASTLGDHGCGATTG